MAELKIVPRLSITAQARRAIAEYHAEQNGRRLLTDEEIARVDDLTAIETVNGQIMIDNHDLRGQFTWRSIFESKAGLNLSGAARAAKESGYRFLAHEGRVFFVSFKGEIEDAGLTVEEINKGEHS